MRTFAKIDGQVVSQGIMAPTGGQTWKPFNSIQVLQKINDRAELVTVKDYEITREYNGKFSAVCVISAWAGKNGNAGLNITVSNEK